MNRDCEIVIAPASGFCVGVEVAVQKALNIVKNKKEGHVFLEGELVHNRDVNEQLRKNGVKLLQPNMEIDTKDTIIIRAHGISPERRAFLDHFGCEIQDATCPLVRRIANIIEANKDKKIILLGDRGHVEVEGLRGYAKNIYVCRTMEELTALIDRIYQEKENENYPTRTAQFDDWVIICQSTLDIDFLKEARILCKEKCFAAEIFDTICSSTKQRQLGLKTLENCDLVIIVGGINSANTKRLFEKMKLHVASVIWVENAKDLLDMDIRFDTYSKIGIAAGASTPRYVVQEIYTEISKKIA
jgi:4-hydroxy-3-methylbut-2-enyl diphosphate reductase